MKPTPTNHGKVWTKEEERELLRRFFAGDSRRKAAAAHERLESAVDERIRKLLAATNVTYYDASLFSLPLAERHSRYAHMVPKEYLEYDWQLIYDGLVSELKALQEKYRADKAKIEAKMVIALERLDQPAVLPTIDPYLE